MRSVKAETVYQPVHLGERDDIAAPECTVNQLKYKMETGQAAA